MSELFVVILLLNVLFFAVGTFVLLHKKDVHLKRKVKEIIDEINEKVYLIDSKIYFEIDNMPISNISAEDIVHIKEKLKKDESHFGEYVIEKDGDVIKLLSQQYKNEIEKIKEKYEESLHEQEKLKDKEYYYYKEFAEKLTYVLKEINEFHREIRDISNLNIKFKLENIKDKVEFILEFFREKGTLDLHKYKLYRIRNLVDLLKEEFEGKLSIEFKIDNNVSAYYVEIEKIFAEIKAILYLVLKMKISEVDKNINLNIKVEDGYIKFIIKNNTSNFSFIRLIDEDFMFVEQVKQQKWRFTVEENLVSIDVPIHDFGGELTDEIKTMTIHSHLDQIKDVIKLVLYDMNKYGFDNNEIYDMRLTLDELLVNAIEHGNKFDKAKHVFISYKFSNDGKKVAIEIEDEGEGFDHENIREPDILSMRGRGISITKKLVNEMKYSNGGRKVAISKEKEV